MCGTLIIIHDASKEIRVVLYALAILMFINLCSLCSMLKFLFLIQPLPKKGRLTLIEKSRPLHKWF